MNFNYSENLNQLGQFGHEADFSISNEPRAPLVSGVQAMGYLAAGVGTIASSVIAIAAPASLPVIAAVTTLYINHKITYPLIIDSAAEKINPLSKQIKTGENTPI